MNSILAKTYDPLVVAEARPVYTLPNKMCRILLLALGEVMGKNGLNAVLNTASLQPLIDDLPPSNFDAGLTFEENVKIFEAVEGIYGVRGGRRLIRQAGRICFKYGVQDFGFVIGIADFFLRMLPISFRMRIALEVLAEIFNRYSDQQITLAENEEYYFFILNRCCACWGRHTRQSSCAIMVGLLDETLYWISRGRRFEIDETSCIAKGDPVCKVSISKEPLM
ncbi:MAG: 4-vinyl reductase [Anaerolineae bacterium]|nr:4-vinyl reductase [Anaerolineae bacterium]